MHGTMSYGKSTELIHAKKSRLFSLHSILPGYVILVTARLYEPIPYTDSWGCESHQMRENANR